MMNGIQLQNIDLNLLVIFEVLMEEQSVVRAADRLGRTPSAISHALARLRQTFGDPLLVKAAGRMKPSPLALTLIEEVRPILRGIQRLVQPPEPFDAATSSRVFRIAGPQLDPLIVELAERVNSAAPNIRLEWVPQSQSTYAQIADEQIDLAYGNATTPLPDGIRDKLMPAIKRFVFARKGHPAASDWNVHSWLRWPHIVVALPTTASSDAVERRIASQGLERRIGLRVPNWSAVGPALLRTNMFANQNATLYHLSPDLDAFEILEPPIELPALRLRALWNARLDADPAQVWLRTMMIDCMEHILETAHGRLEKLGLNSRE
ncbi:LysR family transcriptional regulator [Roseibium aggregatum]|uniref:LysR family transcriptional regulator n=1 Tax=Roseibium aggregatum TaxID=187304 RepID=A0A926P1T8_9HYPH|nr:LysR family transcriptional regulator [Roseibium aggregatum]MBD1549764.1 LysR family transcriptional regulator [Roseibium aggregatum]